MNDALRALKQRFLERCERDLVLVEQAMEDPAVTATADFAGAIHKLSGAAGSFGYAALSDLAGLVDDELMADGAPSQAALLALAEGLRSLKAL